MLQVSRNLILLFSNVDHKHEFNGMSSETPHTVCTPRHINLVGVQKIAETLLNKVLWVRVT